MSRTIQQFRVIRRPATVKSLFSLIVVDGAGRPQLPLTTFYHQIRQQLADGTARICKGRFFEKVTGMVS